MLEKKLSRLSRDGEGDILDGVAGKARLTDFKQRKKKGRERGKESRG